MRGMTLPKANRFQWNIQIPLPKSGKSWLMIVALIVGLVTLTAGLGQIFRVDLSPSDSVSRQTETPQLDWREMISVLSRYGARSSDGQEEVALDVLLTTPQYLAAAHRQAPGAAADEPSLVFYVTETTHIDDLPPDAAEPVLVIGSKTYAPTEVLVMADSPHHRSTVVRYAAEGLDLSSGMSLTIPGADKQDDDDDLRWDMPIQYTDEYASSDIVLGEPQARSYAPEVSGVAVLAVMGGLLAAMWPCLFQLTAYFIPAMAGMSMQEASETQGLKTRAGVVKIAFFFVLGFTVVYTLAGAAIGYGSQQLSGLDSFYVWQRYLSIGAGIILFGLALRVAARARAPLVCKMPIVRRASKNGVTSPWESMVVGFAFATGCMTCFGSAVLIGMILYVGLEGSPLVGATLLFMFSLGMGIPLVFGAIAMAKVLPLLFKMEKVIPWMGLASAILIAGYGIILITGNFMVLSSWAFRVFGIDAGI